MEPLISVIVPVYQVERYLDRCLASLTCQKYGNLEILLVDDGSPDQSGAICDRWAEKDSRIRVIHRSNQGAGAARNVALDEARGALIGFVDSDDYVSPSFYSDLYAMLDEETDIAECGYLETREEDAQFDSQNRPVRRYTAREAMAEHIRDRVFRQLIWNKLYRREMVEDVRFPVGTGIDDEYFTYQTLGRARGLKRSDKVLYAYRQQENSIMHRPYSIKRLNGIRAKEDRLRYLQANMPELVPIGRDDLLMSCLYGMQGTLRNLTGDERKQAEAFLTDTVTYLKSLEGTAEDSRKRKALLNWIQRDPKGAARFLNLLEDLHILK